MDTPSQTPAGFIEYAGVHADAARLANVEGGRVVVAVPRVNVESVAARYGSQSAHPLPQVLLGLVLCLIGFIPVILLIVWLIEGGKFSFLVASLVLFLVIGPWLVYDATKRGFYLDVSCRTGRRRLAFDRSATAPDVDAFLREVEAQFGYKIDRNVARLD